MPTSTSGQRRFFSCDFYQILGFLLCWSMYVLSNLLTPMREFWNFPTLKLSSQTFSPFISQSLKQTADLVLMVSYICYVAQGDSLRTISDPSPSVSLVLCLIGSKVCKQEQSPPIKLYLSFTHVCLSLYVFTRFFLSTWQFHVPYFFASGQRYIVEI